MAEKQKFTVQKIKPSPDCEFVLSPNEQAFLAAWNASGRALPGPRDVDTILADWAGRPDKNGVLDG